jgi:hypothetical protein
MPWKEFEHLALASAFQGLFGNRLTSLSFWSASGNRNPRLNEGNRF